MDNKIYKIADQICNNLILLWETNQTKNKTLIQLYHELLDQKYNKYQYDILSYIPECLAKKGYEIVTSDHFEIKKY